MYWIFVVVFSFTVLSGKTITIQAAFGQGEESLYLTNFDSIVADSYAEVDQTSSSANNQEVLTNCQGGNLPTNTVEITSPSEINSSDLASQCTKDDICIIASGVSLVMDSSLAVGALIIRGSLQWNDETQTDESQYLCGGYIVVENQGQFQLNLNIVDTNKKAWVYIRNNGAVHSGLKTRAFGSDAMGSSGNPVLEVQGRHLERTWSLLSKPLTAGSTTMTLLHNPTFMGWKVGDRIAIAPMKDRAEGYPWNNCFE